MDNFLSSMLTQRREASLLRSLKEFQPLCSGKIAYQGREFVNFSSNDYLGLAHHPNLKERSIQAIVEGGAGATASRLICGTSELHHQVETKLAQLTGRETALLLTSGFQTNSTLLSCLTDRNSLILMDRDNHNSLVQGSTLCAGRVLRYRHGDFNHIEDLLQKNRTGRFTRRWIVTESLFSMEGDQIDLTALCELARDYDAHLFVDDAHAFGTLGPQGMGLAAGKKEIALTIGTFGKAAGSFGAYVTASSLLKEYLINFCPGFIYTTALPPAVVGSILAALELIPQLEKERQQLKENGAYLRQQAKALGFDIGLSSSHIIPLIVGSESAALSLSSWLEKNGVIAHALRPPTVKRGSSRVRICLSSAHSQLQIDELIALLGDWRA